MNHESGHYLRGEQLSSATADAMGRVTGQIMQIMDYPALDLATRVECCPGASPGVWETPAGFFSSQCWKLDLLCLLGRL